MFDSLTSFLKPDILICRTEHTIPEEDKAKIALFCNVGKKAVIEEKDKDFSIYEVPLGLVESGLDQLIVDKLRLNQVIINLLGNAVKFTDEQGEIKFLIRLLKESVFSKITRAVAGKSKVDDEVLDELEEILVSSDVGVDTTLKIIERIQERVARDKYVGTDELNSILKDEIASLLAENNTTDADSFNFVSEDFQMEKLIVYVLTVTPSSAVT